MTVGTRITNTMGKALSPIQMETNTSVSGGMMKSGVKAPIHGQMATNTLVNGSVVAVVEKVL